MNGSLVFDAWLHEFREFVSPSSILESGHGEGWDWDQRVSLMRFELFKKKKMNFKYMDLNWIHPKKKFGKLGMNLTTKKKKKEKRINLIL